jgi:hypothetical protein
VCGDTHRSWEVNCLLCLRDAVAKQGRQAGTHHGNRGYVGHTENVINKGISFIFVTAFLFKPLIELSAYARHYKFIRLVGTT